MQKNALKEREDWRTDLERRRVKRKKRKQREKKEQPAVELDIGTIQEAMKLV